MSATGASPLGGALHQLVVLGWLGLVTVPLGLAPMAVGTLYLVLTRRRRR